MGRRSKRRRSRTSTDQSMYFVLAGGFGIVLLISLATEYPVLAALLFCALPIIGVAGAAWLWQHRRRTHARESRMRLLQTQRLGNLLTVSGAEFESMIAELFRALGYRDVERIGGSGDLGVDLLETDPDGFTVVVQCKRYGRGNKIGSPAIQSLMGTVVNQGADRGILVTTSDFTAPAVALANTARVPISLVNSDDITRRAIEAMSDDEVAGSKNAWNA